MSDAWVVDHVAKNLRLNGQGALADIVEDAVRDGNLVKTIIAVKKQILVKVQL